MTLANVCKNGVCFSGDALLACRVEFKTVDMIVGMRAVEDVVRSLFSGCAEDVQEVRAGRTVVDLYAGSPIKGIRTVSVRGCFHGFYGRRG